MARVLLVEDEHQLRHVLGAFLRERGYDVSLAATGEEALESAGHSTPDVVVIDLNLPGIGGLEVLANLKDRTPDVVCVLITAFATIRSAVDAIRAGADDYLTKPFDNDELVLAIDRSLRMRRLSREVEQLRDELDTRYGFDELIGISPSMREVFRVMKRVSSNAATVLILGETGTGKELVARSIHRRSPRRDGPFVAVNCGAIPSSLVEAEFFGHERGAYTDAREMQIGRFEQANGGTLFLDEVGDLALDAQSKLLRVLQERELTRVGGRRSIKVDARIVAATHRDLESLVRKGLFREDLFWRLNVVNLRLPALRERPEDLPLLIDMLLDRLAQELMLDARPVSPEARRLLMAHDWPGNVRELENTLRRACILCEGLTIVAKDLPARIRGESEGEVAAMEAGCVSLAEAVRRATERIEKGLIHAALQEHYGNRTATAESLGVNRKTLFNKMKSYGMVSEADAEHEG